MLNDLITARSAVVGSWEEQPNIWLTVAENQFVGWILNCRVRVLLKGAVMVYCNLSGVSKLLFSDLFNFKAILLIADYRGWPPFTDLFSSCWMNNINIQKIVVGGFWKRGTRLTSLSGTVLCCFSRKSKSLPSQYSRTVQNLKIFTKQLNWKPLEN